MFFAFAHTASAHNQEPVLIRKTLKVAFEKFNAPVPSDYIKSTNVSNIAGKTVEYYSVKDSEGKVKAVVGKLEVQEVLYAIGVDAESSKVTVVSKRGKELSEEEIKSLEFVEPVAQGLLQRIKKG